MTTPALKPCPFCGERPVTSTIKLLNANPRLRAMHIVTCTRKNHHAYAQGYTKAVAYRRWNTRARPRKPARGR